MPLKKGKYHISITVNGITRNLDLLKSDVAPNTPIVGFAPVDSKPNQKWEVDVKGDIGTIRSILSEKAYCAPTSDNIDGHIVIGDSVQYEFHKIEDSGNYQIRIRGKTPSVVWSLADSKEETPVVLQAPGIGSDEWNFRRIFGVE